jgi:hypothetical protein
MQIFIKFKLKQKLHIDARVLLLKVFLVRRLSYQPTNAPPPTNPVSEILNPRIIK